MDKTNNARVWLNMFAHTLENGRMIKPRGEAILEIEDLQITIDPSTPFMNFNARKYDVNYFKKEMIWKLSADPYNSSIMDHAKIWKDVQNPNGTFNSNYGQYWFGEQMGFFGVISELLRDIDSRRAVIPMLSKDHLSPDTKDQVCTECIGFRIRDNSLNMSVHMRSSDQIFGLGTDIPTFSFLYRLVYSVMKGYINDLQIGTLTITAMSSHIYSRHFDMVMEIITEGLDKFTYLEMPWPSTPLEAIYIAGSRGKNLTFCDSVLGTWVSDIS